MVLCGGEALPRSLANELAKRSDSVWNLYGPTETTIWSAVSRISREDGPVSIGRPLDNTEFYVLDRGRNLVPTGVPGELYIGGAGLSHGYLNNAELTLQRFVPNPFADSAATRLYKTGDEVAWLPSGQLEYLGRIDDQVKLRGFRIDPGEIETVITQFPGV